jgi:hypothetical protein
MSKKQPPTLLQEVKALLSFFDKALIIAVFIYDIFAIAQHIETSIPENDYLENWWLIILAVLLTFLIIFHIGYKYFKQRTQEGRQFSLNKEKICVRNAHLADLRKIVELDIQELGPKEYISEKVFRKWFEKNEQVFRVAECNGEVVGYHSILPLKKETLKKFIDGKVREKSFKKRDILSTGYFYRLSELYVFSVVIDHKMKFRCTKILFNDIVNRLTEIRDRGQKLTTIYATAASRDGKKLLDKLDFTPISEDSKKRKDKHPLYVRNIDPDINLRNILRQAWKRLEW